MKSLMMVQWQFPLDNCSPDNCPHEIPPRTIAPLEVSLRKNAARGFARTIALKYPPSTTTPWTIASWNSPQGNCTWIIFPLGNLEIVSSWVVLSLNFTLAKRVLQVGIIVNPSLGLRPFSTFFHWYCVTESLN